MWIYVWDAEIKWIYLWDTLLKEVYLWDTKIRPTIKEYIIDFLVVGGWWGWGWWARGNAWWWGWAWGVIYCSCYTFQWDCNIVIGAGGTPSSNWGNSCFGSFVAYWWWYWGTPICASKWRPWGAWASWWGGSVYCAWGTWCQWNAWWTGGSSWWWGWGWFCSAWISANGGNWWWGGLWFQSNITGSNQCYAWWWGWWAWYRWGVWAWCYGWGNGGIYADRSSSTIWCPATRYWSWWWWQGGSCYNYGGWAWCQGIVVVRYPTACWYNLSWGTKYTCGNYTIHCFTSDWTLTIS